MKLYNDLMNLCSEEDSAFFFKDLTLEDGRHTYLYRVFNYRLASYSDFCKPGAMECRGIMFELLAEMPEGYDRPRLLAAMPMEKFFNKSENPKTMNLDLSNENVSHITHKKDGSLISTFMKNDKLFLKSKGSLESDQVKDATKWLFQTDNIELLEELCELAYSGVTVNMEWCSPDNRIVIGYKDAHLSVLNVRRVADGKYVPFDIFKEDGSYPEIIKHWTLFEEPEDTEDFINNIPSMTDDIEGFVVELKDGQKVKIKTDKYLKLHHCKDNVNNPRRLFEAVVTEAVDDMKSLFFDDPEALNIIREMEELVEPEFNHLVATVEEFYEKNKDLDRKDYAIKGQTYRDGLFSLKMHLYLEKEPDYKYFACKHPEQFGLNFKKED